MMGLMGKKILYLEDDVAVGKMYKTALEKQGYEVDLELDSIKAQKSLNGLAWFDLLLLDIILPVRSGLDLLKEIRSGSSPAKNIPAYILTNVDRPDYRQQATALGVQKYLLKLSTTPNLLVEEINQFFSKK